MDTFETTVYHAILISGAVIGTVIIYFILSIIRQQRINTGLQRKAMETEMRSTERERQRIASDLHDELGPLLSSAKYKLSAIEVRSKEDELLCNEVDAQLETIMERIRAIANGLMPNTLLRQGIAGAMEELVRHTEAVYPLRIDLQQQGVPNLSQEMSIQLYRMMQEIVHNCIKHARASELSIQMGYWPEKVVIIARDNGSGFRYQEAERKNKLGLFNSEEPNGADGRRDIVLFSARKRHRDMY